MNEPARPAAARPVLSVRFLVHIPTRSRLGPGRAICVCVSPAPLYSARPCNRLPLRVPRVSIDPRGNPARAGLEPDASPRDTLTRATLPAAPPQALRAHHSDRSTPLSRSVSLSLTASHPRVGAGNVSRPLLRCRHGEPATDPTPAHGTHCPPIGRFRVQAPSARAPSAQSVSRPIFGSSAECTFPSPPLLSVQRVACLPN